MLVFLLEAMSATVQGEQVPIGSLGFCPFQGCSVRRLAFVCCTSLTIVIASCSSSPGTSSTVITSTQASTTNTANPSSTTTISNTATKAGYMARANALCSDFNNAVQTEISTQPVSTPSEKASLLQAILPAIRTFVSQLKALPVPPGDASSIQRIDGGLNSAASDAQKVVDSNNAGDDQGTQAAIAAFDADSAGATSAAVTYGFSSTSCIGSPSLQL